MKVLGWFRANRWLRYALTLLLLGLVVLKVQPGHLLDAVGSARPGYLFVALLLTAPFLYLKALRWHLMLRAAGIEASMGEAFLSLIGGMGLALVTPARLGEVVRGAYLRDGQKLKIAGLVLIDKGFDVLVLGALSTAGAWVLLGFPAGLALLAVTVAGLAVVYNPAAVHRHLLRAAVRLPLAGQTARSLSSLESLSPSTTTIFIALTLASFLVVLLQFGIILLSWHGWSPDVILLTFPLVILTNVLPLTVGGLGIREGAAVLLLAHFGVSSAHAGLAAFLMFSINTALPGIAGALLVPTAGPRAAVAGPDQP